MNKSEMVTRLHATGETATKAQAQRVVDKLMEITAEALERDGEVVLHGVGRLIRKTRKARNGRNPQTGETIVIPSKQVIQFKVGRALDTRVNA